MSTGGLCRHCGRSDAPVDPDGYLDRHRRADWNRDVDPGNEVCAAGGFGAYQRPGEACRHLGPESLLPGPAMSAHRRRFGEPDARSHRGWRPQPVPDPRVVCKDLYTGPHNRCRHATPDPRGNRRCEADPACPCMLPVDSPRRVCGWHDETWTDTGAERARRLLGGGVFSGA